jgi:hypothetical protein
MLLFLHIRFISFSAPLRVLADSGAELLAALADLNA